MTEKTNKGPVVKRMPGRAPRGARGMKSGVEHPLGVFNRLLMYVARQYKIHMIFVFLLIIVSVLANVQGTLFTKTLIDAYILPLLKSKGAADFTPLAHAIFRVAGFYALGALSAYIQKVLMVIVTQGTLLKLRDDLFRHMETLPIRYFDQNQRGNIMSVYTNDVDALRQMISESIPQIVNSAFMVVSVLISMFFLSLPLTLVTLFMVVLMMMIVRKIGSMSGKYFMKQQNDLGKLNGYIEEMMAGGKVVKVFSREEIVKEEFREKNDQLFESADRAHRFANLLGPVNFQLGNVSYVVVALVGGALAINHIGGFTLGALASFLTFNRSLNMPINQVSIQLNAIVMAIAGAERVFRLMDEKPEKDEGTVSLVCAIEKDGTLQETERHTGRWAWKQVDEKTGEAAYKPLTGEIHLEEVTFGYDPEKIVLHDITLYAHQGQKIAFVGSTGAGKTTITNLINHFYDIQKGRILFDGIDITRIRKGDLRRSLGMVLQETNLFTGTVADNIRFGKLDATDEEIVAAAKLANADGFIRRLPDGYQTMLRGNGSNLSQGQRQLLAIARTAIADPPALILDEATSSIDTRTEKSVQDGIDKLMEGRTGFVIAHRLSTVRNADCIMVMEQGRIIERGTHAELMEAKGRYFQLYTGNAID